MKAVTKHTNLTLCDIVSNTKLREPGKLPVSIERPTRAYLPLKEILATRFVTPIIPFKLLTAYHGIAKKTSKNFRKITPQFP